MGTSFNDAGFRLRKVPATAAARSGVTGPAESGTAKADKTSNSSIFFIVKFIWTIKLVIFFNYFVHNSKINLTFAVPIREVAQLVSAPR